MTLRTSCPRESEVLDLVAIGQWPARAEAELKAHVGDCELCADLVSVAAAMIELGEAEGSAVRVPDASVVWYRAQISAREELTRRATRPMLIAQLGALAAIVCGTLVAWQFVGTWMSQWWSAADFSGLRWPSFELDALVTSLSAWRWVALALLVWTALIPGAFYLAQLVDWGGEPHADRQNRL